MNKVADDPLTVCFEGKGVRKRFRKAAPGERFRLRWNALCKRADSYPYPITAEPGDPWRIGHYAAHGDIIIETAICHLRAGFTIAFSSRKTARISYPAMSFACLPTGRRKLDRLSDGLEFLSVYTINAFHCASASGAVRMSDSITRQIHCHVR
jgi:hypothetical protein